MDLVWIMVYDDGSTYSNLDGSFEDAPVDGVLGAIEADPQSGYVIYHGKDYYVALEDGTIAMTNDLGPFLRKLGIVKFGRWTGRKPWGEAYAQMVALAREHFPRKSGDSIHEGEPLTDG